MIEIDKKIVQEFWFAAGIVANALLSKGYFDEIMCLIDKDFIEKTGLSLHVIRSGWRKLYFAKLIRYKRVWRPNKVFLSLDKKSYEKYAKK